MNKYFELCIMYAKIESMLILNKIILFSFVETIYIFKNEIQFESYCKKNKDCLNLKERFICFDNKCICDDNYSYDMSDNTCKKFICEINTDCQEVDKNRFCEFGQCKCGLNYSIDSISKICVEKPNYQFYWLWCFLFMIPSVIASIHGLIRKYRLSKKF